MSKLEVEASPLAPGTPDVGPIYFLEKYPDRKMDARYRGLGELNEEMADRILKQQLPIQLNLGSGTADQTRFLVRERDAEMQTSGWMPLKLRPFIKTAALAAMGEINLHTGATPRVSLRAVPVFEGTIENIWAFAHRFGLSINGVYCDDVIGMDKAKRGREGVLNLASDLGEISPYVAWQLADGFGVNHILKYPRFEVPYAVAKGFFDSLTKDPDALRKLMRHAGPRGIEDAAREWHLHPTQMQGLAVNFQIDGVPLSSYLGWRINVLRF